MPLTTILFVVLFILSAAGALYMPQIGMWGYMAHYIVGPERQWWENQLEPWGIRYSFTLALTTAIGFGVHFRSLRIRRPLLTGQEGLLVAFVGLVWVLRLISPETEGYTIVDHPSLKLTKVAIFVVMMTHLITRLKDLRVTMWLLVVCTMLLGYQAYTTPQSSFMSGRLETVGGADFGEANFLPAFVAGILPIMGVLFLTSRWIGKFVTVVAGGLSVNAIILTRSRGAVVGLGLGGMLALLLSPRRYRLKIGAGLVVAGLGMLWLSDPTFIQRVSTIFEKEKDPSAAGRIEIWKASIAMVRNKPQGVGPGNFFSAIRRYNPEFAGRDAHSTFARCWAELGVAGFLLLVALMVNAVLVSRRAMQRAMDLPPPHREQVLYAGYAVAVGLCMMLGCGVTVTLLYTEALWWFLLLPVCVQRVVENAEEDLKVAAPAEAKPARKFAPKFRKAARRPRAGKAVEA